MRLITTSGLRGHLVEYVETSHNEALVIVRRDSAPVKGFDYSTHRVYTSAVDGSLVAEAGHYDMTLEQARKDLDQRLGREFR